jgi:hypothetical protein
MNQRPDGSTRPEDCPDCGGLGTIEVGLNHETGVTEWATCNTCGGSGRDPNYVNPRQAAHDAGFAAGVAACREKIEAAIEKRPGDTDLSGQPLLPGWISASMLLKPDAPVSALDTDMGTEATDEG